ncbi:2-oxoacid:acceptor oxidoreductase family protein, partial [Desulfobacterales bacterium HSG17]|nr:2-oxoacid:acceptor oxidoreductase family protein [Desulfobacterales bacterium HSG17]
WILLNAQDISAFPELKDYKVAIVDAAAIAQAHKLGTRTQPIINTAMTGAFARIMENLPMDVLKEAVFQELPVKQQENYEAAMTAYDAVRFI